MNSDNTKPYLGKKVIRSCIKNQKIDKASQTLLTSKDFSNVNFSQSLMSNEEFIKLFYSKSIAQKEQPQNKISEPSNKKRNNSRSCKNNQGFEQFKKEFLNIYPKETDSNILAQWERMDKETKSMYLNI